jgi:hypothetical protein
MDSRGISFLENELQADIRALVYLQRFTEKMSVSRNGKPAEHDIPSYCISAEMKSQIYHAELEEWRNATADDIRSLR